MFIFTPGDLGLNPGRLGILLALYLDVQGAPREEKWVVALQADIQQVQSRSVIH